MQLSIVMPAHNEGAHIELSATEWYDEVVRQIPGAELVIVDDCSTDDTGTRLAQLSARLPALRVLRTPANGGHGRAVRFGLDRCLGTFVFQTDSDRQHRAADFWALWARREEAEFVFGVRPVRADGAFRLCVSYALRLVNAAVWGCWIRDANCPFKLMRRDALAVLLQVIPRDSFIPMVLVSLLAHRSGRRVIELPVQHLPRTAGEQSLRGMAKWTRIGARCTRELVAARLSSGRSARRERRSGALA